MYILNVLNNTGRVLVTTAIETRIYTFKKVVGEFSRFLSGKAWTGPELNEAATIILQPNNNGKQQRSRDSSGGGQPR